MDFNDSPAEAEFRTNARAWLDVNAGRDKERKAPRVDDTSLLGEGKVWQAKKAEVGYACITWPKEWGGGGGTPMEQVIFNEEEAKHGRGYGFFAIGLGMCVPTVMAFADNATKQRFVPAAVRGEEIWCQLFSEPSAGSDAAASRTRAMRAGDGSGDWILDGQKVWTSGAHYSDFGIVLVRTDPDVPKHSGLTMFWVDMKSPGVDIRPIHQASGESDFNEVYFTDVRVRDSQRLGEVGKGWNVALVTLMNERLAVGGGMGPNWSELLALAQGIPGVGGSSAAEDGGFRERLADWYVSAEGLRLTRYRAMTALSRGDTPGPESAIGKIVSARQMQEIGEEAMNRLDQYGIVGDEHERHLISAFQHNWFWGTALRIAGGTDEILKNIIAERVLGLPLDIRIDRDVAFKDIPRGV
ncbi:acyl-CoA dehydrogenase [Sphingomonas sp. So64.6b]|uniref:acyl-CoA dehydrogenase family protein n=1 Tax=Sphingomonas sp. So64.6b TaxID=2997354 RepID=UPI001604866D|nr:acyl-CoA dehydrogenase family protein [Sphingomonas sp. So64.6b]QNA85540.1 acyl-CoA dehydrogenase [Sphingomonas sp. So64.6b]